MLFDRILAYWKKKRNAEGGIYFCPGKCIEHPYNQAEKYVLALMNNTTKVAENTLS